MRRSAEPDHARRRPGGAAAPLLAVIWAGLTIGSWPGTETAVAAVSGDSATVPDGAAKEGGPCDAPPYRRFDFWLGSWAVRQEIRTGEGGFLELPARDSVSRTLDGCALLEHWEGDVQFFWEGMDRPVHLWGLSVRSYDERSGKWEINWMDSRRPTFGEPFRGGFRDGRGVFIRRGAAPDGSRRDYRIVFSDITPESLEWELDSSRDAGATWTPLWRMHFVRR